MMMLILFTWPDGYQYISWISADEVTLAQLAKARHLYDLDSIEILSYQHIH